MLGKKLFFFCPNQGTFKETVKGVDMETLKWIYIEIVTEDGIESAGSYTCSERDRPERSDNGPVETVVDLRDRRGYDRNGKQNKIIIAILSNKKCRACLQNADIAPSSEQQ